VAGLESDIGSFIATELIGENEGSLPPDTVLLSGLIDSFSLMQLIYHLEDTYEVTFDMEELNDDNFHDIKTVASLVQQKLKEE
jgi:acyl carrier protein